MTIWGSSGGFRNGLNGLQEWTRVDNEIRDLNGGFGMQMRRTYTSALPANFGASEMAADYGKRASSWTFSAASWANVASGSLNSDIIDFCQSIPNDHLAYVGYFHEPEDQVDDGWDWEEWRDAQYQFLTSVIAAGMANVIPTFCLMSWTCNPASGRNVDRFDPGLSGLSSGEKAQVVVGQDGYSGSSYRAPYGIFHHTVAEFTDRGYSRFAIWECGVEDDPWRSQWFAALEEYATDDNIEVINYFHSDTNPDPTTDCWLDLETYDPTALDTWAAIIAGNQDIEVPEPVPSAETRASNIIWVYPQTTPDGGFIGGGGAIGEDSATETGTDWYVTVRDFFDPDTIYSHLFNYKELSFTKTLSDVGFGELVISREDPFVYIEIEPPEDDEQGKRILFYPLLFSFIQNGAERFRMVYDGKNRDRARADAAEEIILSGTGLGEMLSWGVVLPKGWPGQTKARPRKNKDAVWAALFVTLFEEAQDRGEIPDWLSLGFTRERDSYGNRWEIIGDREIEIGSSLLDVITTASDVEEFDWMVTPRGVVHAAPILGADLSQQVRFFTAVTNNEVGATEDRKDLRTVAYVEGVAGRISKVVSNLGTERWGKRAIYLRSEEASSERQRMRVGFGTLKQTKRPTRERHVTVPLRQTDADGNSVGRTAFIDYGVGDLVGLGPRIHAELLVPREQRDVRVQEIAVRVSADGGEPTVELGVEHRLERFEQRVRRLLQLRFGQWSIAKAAREGKVPVANLRDTDAEFPAAGETLVFDDQADDGDGLWKNGLPKDPWRFWYNAPITTTVVSKMYASCDSNRIIRRVSARLGDPSTSGPVTLRLKRNDIGVHTLSIPAGSKRAREVVHIPVTEDDELSVDIIATGSGAGYLQYMAEVG